MDYEKMHEYVSEILREDGSNYMLSDWIVVAVSHGFDEDGEQIAEYALLHPNGGDQHYKSLGLIKYAETRITDKLREM